MSSRRHEPVGHRTRRHFFCLLVAAVVACALQGAAQSRSGLDLSTFDASTRPQDDLFRHVNGGWLARTTIPADRRSAGLFVEIGDRIGDQLREIAERPGRLGTFYATFMDEAAASRQGLRPLAEELTAIDGAATIADVSRLFARLAVLGVRTPLVPAVIADAKRPEVFTLVVRQGGLGLPNREDYVTDAAAMVSIREQYARYLATLLDLAGVQASADAARAVVALETELARVHWTIAQSRDVLKTYNPTPAAELPQRYPGMDWMGWLAALNVSSSTRPVVSQPSYVEALGRQLQTTPIERWKHLMKAAVLDRYAPYLGGRFEEAEFAFRGRVSNGLEQNEPRWRRAIAAANASMGHVVAQEYVTWHFPPESKARMAQLIENLRTAFGEAIDSAEWMSASTKQEAYKKLKTFRANIGYPATWRNYDALDIHAGDLAGNMMRAAHFESRYQLQRVDGPTDPDEWTMLPQIVNASYNARRNSITFPAGILQPPLFDPAADDAVNYGSIGSVIGHEMGHGFDDQGRQSDADGRQRDWWSPEDAEAYQHRAARIVEQFNGFEPMAGLHVNGQQTLGENIGDLTGLVIALRAYHISLGGKPAPVIDRMTGDQRFFAGWAQTFRRKLRDEALRELVLTDPHSPPHFRVNGPVTNISEFYQAFDVKPGDHMFVAPERRTKIW